MKLKILLFFLLSFFITAIFFTPLALAQSSQPGSSEIPGQILVKFKNDTSAKIIDDEIKKHNGKKKDEIKNIGTLVVSVSEKNAEKIVNALSKNSYVEYAEPDATAYAIDFPADAPNDPYFADRQWGLENTGQIINGQMGFIDADIDAQTAWKVTTGTSSPSGGVKVAVLDTGIDQAHPDISAKIFLQKNFTDAASVNDFYGHGTHVSGIIAAVTNNTVGVAGVCPDCRILNGKVLNDSGSGAYSWIANGIIWAVDNGAKVINMSLGGSVKSRTLEQAVNYAWSKGVVVIAAAGNAGNTVKVYPGAYTNVIAVAATNNLDQKAYFSTYGSWVDIAAPGENIYSTLPTHTFAIQTQYGLSQNYDFASGTSMATPMVSGTAALVWSTPYGTNNVSVRSRLESTADKIPGTGFYWSAGRINAGNAVKP